MNEQEYINVSDRVNISTALEVLHHVIPDLSHIIDKKKYVDIIRTLSIWQDKLFEATKIY